MSHFHHQLLLQVGQGSFLVPTWSSQDCYGTLETLFQVLVQWGSFTLKHHFSIKYCFSCVQRTCPKFYWAHWAGCGSHTMIVQWCGSCFCSMVLLQSGLGFVVRQTWILEWSLIYRGLPYFFLHLHSPTGINYLITNFVPLLCPYQYEGMDLLVFFWLLYPYSLKCAWHIWGTQWINSNE